MSEEDAKLLAKKVLLGTQGGLKDRISRAILKAYKQGQGDARYSDAHLFDYPSEMSGR